MSKITEAEKKQRLLAVESAIGTHAMEGIRLDPEVRSIMYAFVEGELTLDQFSSAMDRRALATLGEDQALRGAA